MQVITEACNECGQSVQVGTGLFVNRITDLNDKETRIQMRKPFPGGDFICVICDKKLLQKNLQRFTKN